MKSILFLTLHFHTMTCPQCGSNLMEIYLNEKEKMKLCTSENCVYPLEEEQFPSMIKQIEEKLQVGKNEDNDENDNKS